MRRETRKRNVEAMKKMIDLDDMDDEEFLA